MTRSELAMGLSIFLVVAVAGFVSTTYVDRNFAAAEARENAAHPACLGQDGSWKNWPWPNVPALSPKC